MQCDATSDVILCCLLPAARCLLPDACWLLQEAHALTLKLSGLLAPPIKVNIGVSLSFGFVWGAAAIIPREQLLRDGTQKYFPPWLLYGFVLVMFVNAIWHLRGGAQASASCTELLDAVSSLRLLPLPDRQTDPAAAPAPPPAAAAATAIFSSSGGR